MKKYFFCLLFVLSGAVAFAQKAVMMGKITDGNGKPVSGAVVKVTGHKVYYKMTTDNGGLYNTPMIDATSYHVIIDANGKYYTSDKVKVSKQVNGKEFYNFTLGEDRADLHIDEGTDAGMLSRMEKIEAEYNKTIELNAAAKKEVSEGGDVAKAPENDRRDEAPTKRNNNTSVKIIPGEKVPQQDK